MKQILFVEQFFWPEAWPGARIPQQIASHLGRANNITVVCGNRPYIKPTLSQSPVLPSYISIRHFYLPFSSHKSVARVINQIFFSIQLLSYICTHRPNLIISQTNPPLALIVLAVTKKLLSIPYIVICMDLYPDVLISSIQSKFISRIVRLILTQPFRFVYNTSSTVVSIDKSMSIALRKYIKAYHKIKLIYNWSILQPPDHYKSGYLFNASWPEAKVKLLYSGNVGSSHELSTILNPLTNFSADDCRLFVLTSRNNQTKLSSTYQDIVCSSQLILRDFQSDDDYSKILSSTSLGVVSLKLNSVGNVSPSKFQTYLSHSVPILYIGPPSDISRLIQKYNAGFVVPNGETTEFVNAIACYLGMSVEQRNIYRRNALRLYTEVMTPEISLAKYSALVSRLI